MQIVLDYADRLKELKGLHIVVYDEAKLLEIHDVKEGKVASGKDPHSAVFVEEFLRKYGHCIVCPSYMNESMQLLKNSDKMNIRKMVEHLLCAGLYSFTETISELDKMKHRIEELEKRGN